MSLRSLLKPILHDDRITRGLDDAEARMLIDWLVDRVERLHAAEPRVKPLRAATQALYRHARAIARFVDLWCHERSETAALQLAATQRFGWPLPTTAVDPCDLLNDILAWEDTPEHERDSTEYD